MKEIVPRTCTEIRREESEGGRNGDSGPLRDFWSTPAYVLLGDPGSGKSTEFQRECGELGKEAELVTARDFITFEPSSHPEWLEKTLFIDGLDEVRSGTPDPRSALDQIRGRLDQLKRPKFRISCREADWLGGNDQNKLTLVSQDSQVRMLRLNELTDSDVACILKLRPEEIDADAFIAEAARRGIEGLLYNPQSLNLLADVVARDGGWPESRLEVFEKACRQMVAEQNEEHGIALTPVSSDQLLDAAGRLCAVQLVSGKAGFTLRHQVTHSDHIPLEQVDSESPEMLRRALSTRLFTAPDSGRFAPVHRHIAEFLGARHLASRVEGGLPVTRVLSLLCGVDGIVVTELRGLSAWLAAHCQEGRNRLIDSDPFGIGLYGDISGFSTKEKRRLVQALSQELSVLGYPSESVARAFAPLATPDMVDMLREILTDLRRDRDHAVLVLFLLEVLQYGRPLSGLTDTLIKIVRDGTWGDWVKREGIHALVNNGKDDENTKVQLKALLADVCSEQITDPDEELRGTLLAELYPLQLGPEVVWNYLTVKGRSNFFGACSLFWNRELLDRSSKDNKLLAQLLDHLQERLPGLRSALSSHGLSDLPSRLLAPALEEHGDAQPPARLYDWLCVGSFQERGSSELTNGVSTWLGLRPEVQKAVLLEGLTRRDGAHLPRYAVEVQGLFQGAVPPVDFGAWCLEQALAAPNPQAAGGLLQLAVNTLISGVGAEGLSLDAIVERTFHLPELKETLSTLLSCELPPGYLQDKQRVQGRRYVDRDGQEKTRWIAGIRSHSDALRENTAAVSVLYALGRAYLYQREKFTELLGQDSSLHEAALASLRGAICRADVPEVAEIISEAAGSRAHYIALPFLVGLDEIERVDPELLIQMPEAQMRKALAFYYCNPTGRGETGWYKRWLQEFPLIVGDVLTQCAQSAISNGAEHVPGLSALAHQRNHAEVAQQVSLPLLKGFPARCRSQQLAALDFLLRAAQRHADRASFLELIERKLALKSMNVAQRAHWLAMAAILSPDRYLQPLESFVAGHEDRVRQLATVLSFGDELLIGSGVDSPSPMKDLGIPVLELLIRLIGRSFGPVERPEIGERWERRVTEEYSSQGLVRQLIQWLASLPDEAATMALEALSADEELHRWHHLLEEARHRQLVIRRDARYRHSGVDEICRTLDDNLPANAGDLAALVVDLLREIGEEIRNANTDDWHQYWNEDSYRHLLQPKPELSLSRRSAVGPQTAFA